MSCYNKVFVQEVTSVAYGKEALGGVAYLDSSLPCQAGAKSGENCGGCIKSPSGYTPSGFGLTFHSINIEGDPLITEHRRIGILALA